MKLLIVSQHFYPDDFRINDIATELVNHGYDVTVLTSLPSYSTGKVQKEYRGLKNRKVNINGVKVIRSFSFSRRKGVLFRALNYVSFMLSSTFKGARLSEKFDLVFCYQTSPVLMANAAIKVAKKQNIPFLIYCLDIWPECIKAWSVGENSLLYKAVHKYSRKIYNSADMVAVSSKPFINYLHDVNGVYTEKAVYLPQHAEDMNLTPSSASNDGKTHFAFGGNIGSVQNVECIIKAANEISKSGINNYVVDIFGDGSELDNCKALCNANGLQDAVIFHGRVKRNELWKNFESADAFLLTLKQSGKIGLTVPAKLSEYMSGARPVFASIEGGAADIINESNCGCVAAADDYKALSEYMSDFIQNPDKYSECGNNGRQYYLSHFTKERVMELLEGFLNEVASIPKNINEDIRD